MRYEKAEILLSVALRLHQTRIGLTLDEIASEFGVSRRTAERWRDAIERTFPQFEQANPGERPKRWRLPSGTLSRVIAFRPEEITGLQSAADLLRRENLDEQAATIDDVTAKLKSLIPERDSARIEPDLEALLEAEGLAMRPGHRPNIHPEVLENLREAIKACLKTRLHYRSRETGELSRQLVCPYGFLYGNRHYLVAYSLNPQVRRYRLFSLSNIERVEVTEWPYERREDFSLKDYAENSFGVFQEEPFDVVWRFMPEVAADAREFRFHPTQIIDEEADGSVIVRFRAGGELEMCWHLMTWGDAVEVIIPASLRKRLKATANMVAMGARKRKKH